MYAGWYPQSSILSEALKGVEHSGGGPIEGKRRNTNTD